MSALDAIVQGIIQGITEFLPISSSGHQALYQHFFGQGAEGSVFFSIMLRMGTLVAVIAAFYDDVWMLIKEFGACLQELVRGRFTLKAATAQRKMLFMLVLASLPLLVVAFLHKWATGLAQDGSIILEGVMFLLTAALLFLASKMRPGKAGLRQMKPRTAFMVGIMQGVAVLPGFSRSGATISTGMILGFDSRFMVRFSFLMAIPTILGSVVFDIGAAVKQESTVGFGLVALGILTAAVFGYLSIAFMRWAAASGKLVYFAWYALILGAVVLLVGIIQQVAGAGGAGASSSVAGAVSSLVEAVSSAVSSGSVPAAG